MFIYIHYTTMVAVMNLEDIWTANMLGAIYLSHREFHMPQQDALSSAQKKKAP